MRDVVIDTDVASQIQKRRTPAWAVRHLAGARVWLTFVSVGELAKWAEVRGWGARSRRRMDTWVGLRPVIPYDAGVCRTWGQLAGAGQLRGRTPPQNDTWVAACCIFYDLPLLTLNRKDFVGFEQHGLLLLGPDD